MSQRSGFALLAVLWVTVALAGLTAGTLAGARAGFDGSAQRIARLKGRWAAEGCLAVSVAALDSSLRQGRQLAVTPVAALRFANGAECEVSSADPSATPGSPYAGDRINLNAAPDSVLFQLPGFSREVLDALARARSWNTPVGSLEELVHHLSPDARSALLVHYLELLPRVSFRPSSILLQALGGVPGTPGSARIDLHVADAGQRVAALHRWIR